MCHGYLWTQDNAIAEFAIVIGSQYQGLGLGRLLLQAAIDYCKEQGVASVQGTTLWENTGMIELARKLGFTVRRDFEEGTIEMILPLNNE